MNFFGLTSQNFYSKIKFKEKKYVWRHRQAQDPEPIYYRILTSLPKLLVEYCVVEI